MVQDDDESSWLEMVAILKDKELPIQFWGGMRTEVPADELEGNQSPLLQNIDPSADLFAAKRRGGFTNESASQAPNGSQGCSGIFRWLNPSSGAEVKFVTEGQKLYTFTTSAAVLTNVTPAGWTPTADTEVYFASLAGKLVMAAKGDAPMIYDGTSWSALGGGAATDMWCVCSHGGRIFGLRQTSPNHNVLVWCAIGNPEDWTSTDNASVAEDGTVGQSIGDGLPLTGLLSAGDFLYIFKDNFTYVMAGGPMGTSSRAFNFLPLVNKGLASALGKCAFDGNAVWASHSDIVVFSPTSGRTADFGKQIHPDYEAIADKRRVCLCSYKEQVWVFYPTTSAGSGYRNDQAFVNRVKEGRWAQYTNMRVRCAFSYVDTSGVENIVGGTSPASGGNLVQVRRYDQGTDDVGAAISVVIETPDLDFGDKLGRLDDVTFSVLNNNGTLALGYYLDRTLQATALTPSFQPGTQGRYMGRIAYPVNVGAYLHRLRFTESTTGTGFGKLYGCRVNGKFQPERKFPL